jgi:phospholipid/cholesterol/gamma-HCH transport system substrate-binding protein
METRANYVLIGVFTIAVVAAIFGFVYWFQHIGTSSERAYYRVLFQGSVSGLRTGGSVLFNGIRVGEVAGLKLDPKEPDKVAVTISVDKSVLVRPDTKVSLEFQGLTGIAALSLVGGSPNEKPLVGTKDKPAVIVANATAAQDVTSAARIVLQRLDEFIETNQRVFNSALKNIDAFTAALARNSDKIDHITTGLENLTGGADGKGGDVNEAARSIKTLADHLDERTAALTTSIKTLSDNLDKRTEEMTKGINHFTATGSRQFELVGRDVRQTLNQIDKTVKNIDKNPSRLLFGGAPKQ